MSEATAPAERPGTTDAPPQRPGMINAVPVRHPWRWVAIAVIAVLTAMMLHLVITNPAFNWPFVFQAMNQAPVLQGLWYGTIAVSVVAMIIAVVLGVIIAVMRLSSNPVLKGCAFVWTWVFRAVPRYVMLSIMGTLGILFPAPDGLSLGVPFDWLLTGGHHLRILSLDANQLFSGFFGAVIGLAVSESAYMAEIARAGIQSVDRGQTEAAQALGMNNRLTMLRVVLPQAMRVIIPPTGSEFISLVKDTSLLSALPLTLELFWQLKSIGSRTYQVFPTFVAGAIYYLIITTILMVLQSFLERHFSKGYGRSQKATAKIANIQAMS